MFGVAVMWPSRSVPPDHRKMIARAEVTARAWCPEVRSDHRLAGRHVQRDGMVSASVPPLIVATSA